MDHILKRIPRLPPGVWQIALLAVAVALPYMSFMADEPARMSVAVLAGIYIMLGLSLNIIVGYAGLFQLGHAAFFGLGAYTAAILSIEHNISILATIPLAALIAGAAAILVSKPILHLRGDYLCIVTIAFGEIFHIGVTNNVFGITGGSNGLFGAGRPEFPLPWRAPVPLIVLVIILVLHVFLSRKGGPLLQWGGAALIALGYYVPPMALDQKPLFVISIAMGLAVLIVGTVLRDHRIDTRAQFVGLLLVVVVFGLIMVLRADPLTAGIERNLDEYFKVEDSVKVLGVELTPVVFKRDARPYYFLVLTFIILTIIGMRRLQNSRLGRAWLYVREDQLAAEAMGIDTTQVKLAAFAIGSAWAGVAGVLYASRFTVVAPENFNFLQSVIMFCIVVLGGSGSIPGVLVGTIGMVVLPELLRDAAPTFLYEGQGPFVILALLLGAYLLSQTAERLKNAAVLSAGIAAAYFLPVLLLDKSPLFVVGIFMALFAVIAAPRIQRRTGRALQWVGGALAIYTVIMLVVGGELGPDVEREIGAFRIMDWRDGLMGVAMVVMMVLRPAGIIPERRQGVVVSPVAEVPDAVPAAPSGRRYEVTVMALLEVTSLSKDFGGLRAIDGLSFSLSGGEIFSIIGPNGAGKTTVFNVITGIYPATTGTVSFDGAVIVATHTGRLARFLRAFLTGLGTWIPVVPGLLLRQLGMSPILRPHDVVERGIARTFQTIRLFPRLTVLENVMAGQHHRGQAGALGALLRLPGERHEEQQIVERAMRHLAFIGLAGKANDLARNLAYGDQRRLEIARALATEPKLLVLDEPAAGLNEAEGLALMETIYKIRDNGITILLIEHDMKVVMSISDRIVVLDDGRKIAEGTPAEIQQDPRVISAYLGEEEVEV